MSLKRTPPKGKKAGSSAISQLLPQQSMDRSLSDSKLSEFVEKTDSSLTQRFKRRRDEDLLTDFNSFKEEIKSMLTSFMTTQQTELGNIKSNLTEIHQSGLDINNAVDLLISQNEEFKKKIEQLEGQGNKDRERISLLEDRIEDMQRESRKTNIEIKNVPKKKNENKEDLMDMALNLSQTVCCKFDRSDIKDIYRINLKKNAEKSSPIIVELGSTILKADILKMCKSYNIRNSKNKLQAKHLGFTTNEYDPIYVTEQLTAKAARLYFLARDLTNSKQYKFCWTSYGRIYVRFNETSPVIQIKNEAQIHHLMQAAPQT